MSASALRELVPNAEIVSRQDALAVNVAAAVGLARVLRSNLGPTGTYKLLVGGAGQLTLTKDGLTLLKDMQIQHPTAALVARTATAVDDICGDGTTSTVLLTGALLQHTGRLVMEEGVHPRVVTDGLDRARDAVLTLLDSRKIPLPAAGDAARREMLRQVARTSLATKIEAAWVETMSTAVVEAIETISEMSTPDASTTNGSDDATFTPTQLPIDLSRLETLTLERAHATESRFIKGLVLDHGGRHPDMPDVLHNVYLLIANFSLEYEQAETSTNFVYQTAQERERLVESERQWLDQRCRTIVKYKRALQQHDPTATMCIVNQKGVDPLSLDIFAKEGILCLRRAKRRNLERLVHATGGQIVLSLEDLDLSKVADDDSGNETKTVTDPFALLGRAGTVRQVSYGEEKWTYVEDCPNATSGTLLLQGPNALTITQIKDAVKDGLRAVKNAVEDDAVIAGGGAFELAASIHLRDVIAPTTSGKATLGIRAFSDALRVIPKTLAANAGYDVQESILALEEEYRSVGGGDASPTMAVGFSVKTGESCLPADEGIYDNVRVKRQSIYLSTVLANQLLLVDEVMRAGKQMGRNPNPNNDDM